MNTPWWRSQEAWNAIGPIFNQIIRHPFLSGLQDGALDHEKFIFYLNQNALYVE